MQLKDEKNFKIGLNKDNTPADLQPGEYTEALNIRTLSSSDQKESGNLETLQGEISLLIAPDSTLLYYGNSIGGNFVYPGFAEIVVGSQVWMKKNWDAAYPGSKVYDNNEDNAAIYGRLYTHGQVMSTGFVPDGWRVPTEADIDILIAELLGAAVAGGKMKEVGDSHWTDPNTGADDSSGFRAVPGGKFDVLFDLLGDNCLLWLQDDGEPTAPVAINGSVITAITFVANWLAVAGVDGYYLDVAEDEDFTSMVAGFDDFDVGNVLFKEVTGLAGETEYFYRVRAYNEVGTSPSSNTSSLETRWRADDWFLPSKDEKDEMYTELHLQGVGGFTNAKYWTSSEYDGLNAWYQDFSTGGQNGHSKNTPTDYVRACRSFVAGIGAYSLRDIGPAGGLIFYIDGAGTTYLEAAPTDQSTGHVWSNINNVLIGTTSTINGEGQNNTNEIIAQAGHAASAAKLCDDLFIDV